MTIGHAKLMKKVESEGGKAKAILFLHHIQ